MPRKLIIAAAGAVFLLAASASAASAEVNFGINLYSGGGIQHTTRNPIRFIPTTRLFMRATMATTALTVATSIRP